MSELEKSYETTDVSMKTQKQNETKESLDILIHFAIHDLHDESIKLLDLTPDNDKDCLTKLQHLITEAITLLRLRCTLDM